jgi:hypothetical protein
MGQSKRGSFSKGRISIVAIDYCHILTFKSYIYDLIFASLILAFKFGCPRWAGYYSLTSSYPRPAAPDIAAAVISSGNGWGHN